MSDVSYAQRNLLRSKRDDDAAAFRLSAIFSSVYFTHTPNYKIYHES